MGHSFKILAFFLLSNILSISTATRAIEPECGSCSKPPVVPVLPVPPVTGIVPPVIGIITPVIGPKLPVPPVTGVLPPVTGIVPPVTGIVTPVIGPKLPVPPVTGVLPPVTGIVPPVTGIVTPVIGPKLPVPPVTGVVPPVTGIVTPVIGVVTPIVGIVPLPPVTTTPKKGKPCAPPAHKKASCPVNTLKLGACASVLGGAASIVLGDPAVNKCCPIISGLLDAEAAACLCTTLKIKALDLKIYVPVALQLLVYCGKTPPPGYTCAV
ncbi:uncharacterized protein [Henckelia pumila]|uniref:uncharacterized protein n=1 Tax=Henckelia pumila TaxID=405737 RepID=UPI003C6E72E6